MDKISPPFLRINFDEIEVVQVFEGGCCSLFEKSTQKLSVFKIISKLNFDACSFIELINEILLKFYENKIKNFKAFIISLDNLLYFYLDEEKIKEANDIIIYNRQRQSLENAKEKIIVFEKLFDNLEIIDEKEKKNFIRAIKSILVDDRVLDGNEINSFIEILTQIFDKNIYEQKEKDPSSEEIMIEKNSDSSELISVFSSYSKNSQHQIRKMQKEIKRLKKLIPKERDN